MNHLFRAWRKAHAITGFLDDFTLLDYVVNIADILLVWYVFYKLIMVIKGTKAVQLLKGIFVIVIVRSLSSVLGFNTLSAIMEQVLTWGFWQLLSFFNLS